jgi:3D (Asp-Asp-Asp) domain-containing protein
MNNFKECLRLAKNRMVERMLLLVSMLALANFILLPHATFAATEDAVNPVVNFNFSYRLDFSDPIGSLIKILNPEVMLGGGDLEDSHLPQNNGLASKYTKNIVLTAYNSEAGQTDDSPCITANGFNVCNNGKEDTVAVNGMKFGTRVRFPELFGNRVFVVRDRMNARYSSNHVDIWMISKADAKKFGVKSATMEVLE